jgi:hypothetical protein
MFKVTTEIPWFDAGLKTGSEAAGWIKEGTRQKATRGKILNFAENTGIPT